MNGYQTMSTPSERSSLLKVLIVDDDAALRKLLAKLIRDTWPLKILEAEDGLEALNLLLNDAADVDIIILDMMMPKISGPEVLKIIRCRPRFDQVPILACTAVNESGFIQKLMRHGIDGYLVKPIDKITFIKKVFPFVQFGRDNASFGSMGGDALAR